MTSRPSQQWLNGVECGAEVCTPPRLCVISWSITVGCQLTALGVVPGGVSICAVKPPSLAWLVVPTLSSGETSAGGDVPTARVGGRDGLDVDVLGAAVRAHVEAQGAGAAGLEGEELL